MVDHLFPNHVGIPNVLDLNIHLDLTGVGGLCDFSDSPSPNNAFPQFGIGTQDFILNQACNYNLIFDFYHFIPLLRCQKSVPSTFAESVDSPTTCSTYYDIIYIFIY